MHSSSEWENPGLDPRHVGVYDQNETGEKRIGYQ